jgi:hypothetical protein
MTRNTMNKPTVRLRTSRFIEAVAFEGSRRWPGLVAMIG